MTQVRRGLGRVGVLLAVTTASGVGCQARDKMAMARAEAAELAARSQRFAARLAMPDPGLGGNKPLARWLLPHELNGSGLTKLHPSDITIDPATGHYVLIASKQSALVEITPSGELVRESSLPGTHPQAEGVAITRDGMLIIGDEVTKQSVATITLYRWPLAAVTANKP